MRSRSSGFYSCRGGPCGRPLGQPRRGHHKEGNHKGCPYPVCLPLSQGGFALIELLIAMVVLSFALALTAQLLMESSQMLADAAAEQTDAPMPLVLARLRGDVRASAGFAVGATADGKPRLALLGHPAGTVVYEESGRDLRRLVVDDDGKILGQTTAMRGLTSWTAAPVSPRLLLVTIGYRRRHLRAGVLAQLPKDRGPVSEERTESILVTPRGAGLGETW